VNSRDAMPTGGTITIETRGIDFDGPQELGSYAIAPGQYVRIEVRDTGMGMDTATLARVFEPFFTTKEVGKGTGLGLATAYGIVKQSGGYIACDSEPGLGTRFQIFLPRSLESAAPVARKVEASPDRRGAETVLLVEDEEGVRRLSRKLLEAYGYRVLEASTGSDAIALAERYPGPIHLMLTDIVMPGMDGPAVASRIQPLRPQMKVLYMSGYSEAEAERLAAVAPLLQKPFTPEILARRVRETLAS
jgi:two-component system, cell cycle sensor histidine kinase and response regulator CckA